MKKTASVDDYCTGRITQEAMEERMRLFFRLVAMSGKKNNLTMMKPAFVDCDYEKKQLTLSFPVLEWELNDKNGMHGGWIACIFDTTFGLLMYHYVGGDEMATISLHTDYIKSVPAGDILRCQAEIQRLGSNIVAIKGQLFLSDGLLAAQSSGIFMRVKNKNGIDTTFQNVME